MMKTKFAQASWLNPTGKPRRSERRSSMYRGEFNKIWLSSLRKIHDVARGTRTDQTWLWHAFNFERTLQGYQYWEARGDGYTDLSLADIEALLELEKMAASYFERNPDQTWCNFYEDGRLDEGT